MTFLMTDYSVHAKALKWHSSRTQAQEEWRKATERFDSMKLEMNETLMQRDDAYMRLFGASQHVAASRSAILPGWGVQR